MKIPKRFISKRRPRLESRGERAKNRALVDSSAFLESLIENLPNMVFVKDAKDLKFVRFNKAAEEILGISRDEMIGRSDADFFPSDEAEHFIRDDRRVLSERQVIDIAEEPVLTRHQGVRILHTKKIPVLGPNREPEYLLGISEDITDIKKTQEANLRLVREEAALKEQQTIARRLEFLSEASKALSSSLDYRVSMQNLANMMVPGVLDWCTLNVRKEPHLFERVVMVHRDSKKQGLMEKLRSSNRSIAGNGRGGAVSAVIASGRLAFYPDMTDEILRRESESDEQYQVLHDIGIRSLLIVPIRVRNKILGAIACCMSDSSRRFEAADLPFFEELGIRTGLAMENSLLYEAAQDAVIARDEFLSIASHELKTPLTSLNLLLDLSQRLIHGELREAVDSKRLIETVGLCQTQAKRLASLVDDLLDVSRMKYGKLKMRLEVCDLGFLARGMADQFSNFMKSGGCSVSLHEEQGVKVYCDRFRIEQVVLNILSNATKYGEKKPIEIFVEKVGKKARLKIVDHGIGIPQSMIDKIFERFERTEVSQKISGLGLGLYISKQIVLAHHGRIYAESKEGSGSTFYVELPLYEGDHTVTGSSSSPHFDVPAPR